MKVAALVGMPGSGKSEVARAFADGGYRAIRFGDITDEAVRKQGLQLNESSEKAAREGLRIQYGMAAYALLNLPKIEAALVSANVVLDGLYSWEEYKYLLEKLGGKLAIVAVWAPPQLRYQRLQGRKIRPLTLDEAKSRDFAEIENVNKGGPIAMADYMIVNDSTLESLVERCNKIIERILL
jgi:dephospho-CoA kinase